MKYDKSINDGDNQKSDHKSKTDSDLIESEMDLYYDLLEEQLETM